MRVAGHTLSRQVMPTRSYLSQSELPVTFGLDATRDGKPEAAYLKLAQELMRGEKTSRKRTRAA